MFGFSPEFLSSFLARNEHSFAKFYEETIDGFYRYIKHTYQFQESQIQDILSESYVKIWNNLDRMNQGQNIQSYCRSIVRNNCLDLITKNKEIYFSELEENYEFSFEETLEDPLSIKDLLEESFQSEQITEALEELNWKYKEVIVLKFTEGFNNSEIASYLGIQEDNVRQRLSRGLSKLKGLLKG